MVADEMNVDKVHQGKYIEWGEVWECKVTEGSNNEFQISIERWDLKIRSKETLLHLTTELYRPMLNK